MSSYYTAAQLEAMRKEKIKKELADSIQRLSIQLQEKHDNSVHISSAGNIELSVFAIDDTTSGSEGNLFVAKENITQSTNVENTQREDLDYQGFLLVNIEFQSLKKN